MIIKTYELLVSNENGTMLRSFGFFTSESKALVNFNNKIKERNPNCKLKLKQHNTEVEIINQND